VTESELHSAVRECLRLNAKEGYSPLLEDDYCYVAPSVGTYPFQWFWDTCFHILMLLRVGEYRLAKRNLESLFAMQEDNGFVGHMIFWKQVLPKRMSDVLQAKPTWRAVRPHMSALIQPPLVGTALLRIYETTQDRVFVAEMFPKLRRLHRWLRDNRDFDGDGLLTIISPFESGMDWKPSFDAVVAYTGRKPRGHIYLSSLYWKVIAVDFANFARRYDLHRIRRRAKFCVKDVAFNTIYALDLDAMARVAECLGEDATEFKDCRRRVGASILNLMYDAGATAFCDLQGPRSDRIPIRTACTFFPLALPEVPADIAERVLRAHFDDERRFALPLPLPSVDCSDPSFSPEASPFLWRGPTWAFINWFLFHALKRRGMNERAERLRKSLWSLIEKSGFREYYNPITGEGYGAEGFTWSGLLVDMQPHEERAVASIP
jgi:glycogen debranching enzyme